MRAAALALLVLLSSGVTNAEEPRVATVLTRYIAWRGGARFEALRSVHERGTLRVGEATGTIERWIGRDRRLRIDRTIGGVSLSEGVTATSDWTVNASGQTENLGDHGLADRRAVALYFAPTQGRCPGERCRLLGTEPQAGRAWTVVRVGFGGNDTYDLLIDPATGELFGMRITQDRDTRLVRYGDWRMVDGVRIAFEEQVQSSNPGGDETSRFASIELNADLAAKLFARPADRQSWSFDSDQHSTGWIPFEFFNQEQIFIPATVNGRSVTAVLDSGADITVLEKKTAAEIGAALSGAVPVAGAGGQATMQLAPNLEVRIGELALRGITAGVMDLSSIEAQLGHPLPMIVGKELFNQLIVDIDFPNRRIAFHERGHFPIPAGAQRVAMGRHSENRTVPVSIEGHEPVDFDFDLGNNSPLIIYPHYRDTMKLLSGRRHSQELSAGVGGMFRPACATLASITIAGIEFKDVPADFPEPANSALNSDRMGGNIGLPLFSRLRMLTDYADDALWLQADVAAVSLPFPKNRAGLIAVPAGDRLKVLMVAPGSPAAETGWKEGEEILAIDGHAVDVNYRSSALSKWATQPSGTRVTLTLADHSTRELVLSDYF